MCTWGLDTIKNSLRGECWPITRVLQLSLNKAGITAHASPIVTMRDDDQLIQQIFSGATKITELETLITNCKTSQYLLRANRSQKNLYLPTVICLPVIHNYRLKCQRVLLFSSLRTYVNCRDPYRHWILVGLDDSSNTCLLPEPLLRVVRIVVLSKQESFHDAQIFWNFAPHKSTSKRGRVFP